MNTQLSMRERILNAGEQLIATRGLDGASLRQISAAAGSGHNGAVQYHFRSKTELVRAILEDRMPALSTRLTLLIAQRRPSDLRSWVECSVLPLSEDAEREGSHYARFATMVLQHDPEALQGLPELDGMMLCFEEILRLLAHVPKPYRFDRLGRAQRMSVYAAAERELAHSLGQPVLSFDAHIANLVDGLVGLLDAPSSPAALAALPVDAPLPPDRGLYQLRA